ncbi:MAG TPA: hypothetical protein VKT78_13885 [Fimbriimonadaceae bacterium]|nr:hypothetical protein [Fimbriimonadaceae bacterium]
MLGIDTGRYSNVAKRKGAIPNAKDVQAGFELVMARFGPMDEKHTPAPASDEVLVLDCAASNLPDGIWSPYAHGDKIYAVTTTAIAEMRIAGNKAEVVSRYPVSEPVVAIIGQPADAPARLVVVVEKSQQFQLEQFSLTDHQLRSIPDGPPPSSSGAEYIKTGRLLGDALLEEVGDTSHGDATFITCSLVSDETREKVRIFGAKGGGVARFDPTWLNSSTVLYLRRRVGGF